MTRTFIRTIGLVVLSAVMAGLGAGTYTYLKDIERAHNRIASGSRIVQTPCGPIEYAIAGDGPPVLVVHGAGGGYDQGLDFGRPLLDLGLRVIAMSRFGYLRTPLPTDASPAAQADAHACLLDALGIERVAVAGGSAGAPSSLQFALRYPGRITALVLLVPATYVPRAGDEPAVLQPPGTQFLLDTALQSDVLFWAVSKLGRDITIRSGNTTHRRKECGCRRTGTCPGGVGSYPTDLAAPARTAQRIGRDPGAPTL